MKIKSVTLKDFRIHQNYSAEFEDGINLISGKNGYGKTSILEAIAFTMFDIEMKDKGAEKMIRIDKETGLQAEKAEVKIVFETSDKAEYTLDATIKKKNGTTLKLRGPGGVEKLTRKSDIQDKILELCKIEKQFAGSIKGVTITKQNKITDIFSDTSSERKKTFDIIFNTAIYGEVSEKALAMKQKVIKTAKDRLEGDIEGKVTELEKYEPLETLKEKEKRIKEEIEALNKEKIETKNKIKELTEKIEEESKKKHTKEKLENDIKSKNELINQIENNILDLKNKMKKIEEAKKIIAETIKEYEAHKAANEKLQTLKSKIQQQEKTEKEIDKNEKSMNEYKHQIQLLKNKNENCSTRINEHEADMKKKEDIIKEHLKLLEEKKAEETKIKEEKDELNTYIQKFNKQKNEIEKSDAKIVKNDEKSEENKIKISNLIQKQEELKLSEKKIKDLNDKKPIKEGIEKEINTVKTKIETNNEAKAALSGGICPYLKENCSNIANESGSSFETYFKRKDDEYQTLKKELQTRLVEYKDLENTILKENEVLTRIKKEIEEIEKAKEENIKLNDEKLKLQEVKEKEYQIIENYTDIHQKALEKVKDRISQELKNRDLEKCKETLNKLESEINSREAINHTEINQINKDIRKTEKEKEDINKKILSNKEEIKENKNEIENLENQTHKLQEENKNKAETIKDLQNLRTEKEETEKLEQKTKDGYDRYNSNKKEADEEEKTKEDIKNKEIKKESETEELNKAFVKLEQLKTEYDPSLIDKLTDEKTITEEKSEKTEIQLKEAEKSQLENNINLRKRNEIEENVKNKKKEVEIMNEKYEILKTLRTNLSSMGIKVSEKLMHTIARTATRNYRMISGNSEEIQWINEEEENYLVKLADEKNIRTFSMLSGGEQISVALAIRAALSTELMRGFGFAIFDEPTTNLDENRRHALAEGIEKLLGKDITQAIIVTHDDTFSTATKTVINTK